MLVINAFEKHQKIKEESTIKLFCHEKDYVSILIIDTDLLCSSFPADCLNFVSTDAVGR